MTHRRHRPIASVRKSVADIRRPAPSIRPVDAPIQSKPTIAPVDRVRTTYVTAPTAATATVVQPPALGAKNTELRSKIAKVSADHRRLRDACTQMLAALGSDPSIREARISAAALAIANAMLLSPDPEAT